MSSKHTKFWFQKTMVVLIASFCGFAQAGVSPDYASVCPSINNVENLAGPGCYGKLACSMDTEGNPVYMLQVYEISKPENRAQAFSDDAKADKDRDRISRTLAQLMIGGVSSSRVAEGEAQACDLIKRGLTEEAEDVLQSAIGL